GNAVAQGVARRFLPEKRNSCDRAPRKISGKPPKRKQFKKRAIRIPKIVLTKYRFTELYNATMILPEQPAKILNLRKKFSNGGTSKREVNRYRKKCFSYRMCVINRHTVQGISNLT